jgi:hypothetical protein
MWFYCTVELGPNTTLTGNEGEFAQVNVSPHEGQQVLSFLVLNDAVSTGFHGDNFTGFRIRHIATADDETNQCAATAGMVSQDAGCRTTGGRNRTGQEVAATGPANVAWRRGSAIIVEEFGGHNSGNPAPSGRQEVVSCGLAKEM